MSKAYRRGGTIGVSGARGLVIFLLIWPVNSCGGSSTGPSPKETIFVSVSGQVFSNVSFVGPCMIAPGVSAAPIECYSGPVAGAVVSTSIDTVTATTDATGRFVLRTNMPSESFGGCQPYTLTITAAGHPTYRVTGPHGTGGESAGQLYKQSYSLSPPTPSIVRTCST